MGVRILLLGSGAREHAILSALLAEEAGHEIIVARGNAGMADDAETIALDPEDPKLVATFALDNRIELVIIGPEAPLVAGVADALTRRRIPVFGPSMAAAQLEGSKAFAKRVMEAAGVPTGGATSVMAIEEAAAALDEFGAPYVVKADGLAAGKGVLVTEDRAAALAHAEYFLQLGPVLIEEFLDGPEVSLFFLADGATVLPLSPAQDYKRLRDGDLGPNTGGMGAYSPLPWLPEGFVDDVRERVAMPVIRQMAEQETPFSGLLYCGLVLTSKGIKVIEFNARFGDPETQVVLPRLVTPLSGLLYAAATGALANTPSPEFSHDACVSVVLASEGYPDAPKTGRPIYGLEAAAAMPGVRILHAATARNGDQLIATGGRVLNVVAIGADFPQARSRVYEALGAIMLEGSHFRTDIAARVAE